MNFLDNVMFRERIIKILIHPFFIGLVIASLVMGFVMPEISRYRVEEVERIVAKSHRTLLFSDLDHDGTSEEIYVDNVPNYLQIMFLRDGRLIEQYNLTSKPLSGKYYHSGDYNRDGFEEFYLLTIRNDSILLSIIDPIVEEDFIVYERLVYYNDTIHYDLEFPEVRVAGFADDPESSGRCLIFSISTGFTKQPRRVFKYDIHHDRLEMSPMSGVGLRHPVLYDLNGDSVPEVLLGTSATGNYRTPVPYSDQSAWLMVLDANMDFLFEPVEFPGYPSSLKIAPLAVGDSVLIAVLHYYFGVEAIRPGLYLFDIHGRLVRSLNIEFHGWGYSELSAGERDHRPIIYVLDAVRRKVSEYDADLNLVRTREIPSLSRSGLKLRGDLDNDGNREMIFPGEKTGSLVIFREGYRHPLMVDLEKTDNPNHYGILTRNGATMLYVQYPDAGYIFSYERNPLFLLKYPFAVAVWLILSMAVWLVFRIQKYRAQRHYITQKKINELQILSLKNQIDPHFTFNILNAIGSLYSKGADRNKAYTIFIKYSDLLRQAIRNSDKISVSLGEEIRFIENYIELEQIRSDYSFQCGIHIDDEVDLGKKIPRMLVYSFVENAIKHGIRMVQGEGRLTVSLTRSDQRHLVSIRDNGPGVNHKTETRIGTGKGLQIIDELIALFYQLEGLKIEYTLRDLLSEGDEDRGTETLIIIPD